jgi:DNA invertase Pin-like site-specific DNA recombinase
MKYHPLANIFPLMEGAAFDALVADIKANGLREPLVMFGDLLLDGRNRWRAAEAAGITITDKDIKQFDPKKDGDPPAWVISKNLRRETGKRTDRPQLEAALAACRLYGAKLIIAKLDRLSRNAHFLLGLEKAGVDFVAADMPTANRLTVGVMALVAEQEGRAISKRTKEALAAAKARGTKLGGDRGKPPTAKMRRRSAVVRQQRAVARATDLGPTIAELQASGATSLRAIAAGLNERGIPTARGGGTWSAVQVQRVIDRLAA